MTEKNLCLLGHSQRVCVHEREKEREKDSSMCWFILQVSAVGGAGLGQAESGNLKLSQ